jgi:putative transposase
VQRSFLDRFFLEVLMKPGKESLTTQRKKVKHYDRPGDAHFLTFSCYRRLPLLSKDQTRHWFIEALTAARAKHEFDLWAWVIMPEHVHLLIGPGQGDASIAEILASIKRPVGYNAIQFLKKDSPVFLERLTVNNKARTYHHFWQPGPGHDKNLTDPQAIHNTVEYIHGNPVRRDLVAHSTDWHWSSARDWAGLGHASLTAERTLPALHPDRQ